MKARYWDPTAMPDEALLDWVNENVVAAIKDCWEGDEKPVRLMGTEGGRIVLTYIGPGKPTKKDPEGRTDNYALKSDILEALREYSRPYKGGPLPGDQSADVLERAAALRLLAREIDILATRAEASVK